MTRAVAFASLSLLALASLPARASMQRYAVIVGNDYAVGEQGPLRYAEDDAAKLAAVLRELGGVAPDDLSLLRGRGEKDLRGAMERIRQKIAKRSVPGQRNMLIFFFSGHSDGVALELGGDRISFRDLLTLLSTTGADVRVAIVDSCRSGGLLAMKGTRPGPAFDIRLSDDPPAAGTVLLTSSASNEQALESEEIRGSFFTHHFVSGLRGAADVSGDGRVTLGEAYQYAYARTVSATAATVVGVQHPGYDYRLSGAGEIVLTELNNPTASLSLPAGFDRALVIDSRRHEVLAEVPAGAPPRLALPEGAYTVTLWKKGRAYAGPIVLTRGENRQVAWTLLAAAPTTLAVAKGAPASETPDAELKRAISLFNAYDEDGARSALRDVIARSPSPDIASRAHLYLGLLQLNSLHTQEAREEFRQALLADPTLELPMLASPKAQLTFAEVRRELSREVESSPVGPRPLSAPTQPAAAPTPAPAVIASAPLVATPIPGPAPAEAVSEAPVEPSHSHVLSYTLGGAAVAFAVVAIAGGVDVLNYTSTINGVNGAGKTTNASQLPNESTAKFFAVGWIVAAGLAAAGVTGAILTW